VRLSEIETEAVQQQLRSLLAALDVTPFFLYLLDRLKDGRQRVPL